jgi:hypothetical protein
MKFTIILATIPALAAATGVYAGVCIDEQNQKQYQDTKNCCAAISGGQHFFSSVGCNCQSLGGIAFRRVSSLCDICITDYILMLPSNTDLGGSS